MVDQFPDFIRNCKWFRSMNPLRAIKMRRCKLCSTHFSEKYKECMEAADKQKANTEEKKMDTPKQPETNVQQDQPKPTEDKQKAKSTTGVLNIAKTMLVENKDNETIMKALIAAYMTAGKDAKKAKHNAQSCLFNARKKLAPKAPKADPTHTTETVATTPTAPIVEMTPVPVDKGPKPAVEIEETTTNGTPIELGTSEFEQQVEGGYTDDDGNPLGTES